MLPALPVYIPQSLALAASGIPLRAATPIMAVVRPEVVKVIVALFLILHRGAEAGVSRESAFLDPASGDIVSEPDVILLQHDGHYHTLRSGYDRYDDRDGYRDRDRYYDRDSYRDREYRDRDLYRGRYDDLNEYRGGYSRSGDAAGRILGTVFGTLGK